MARARDLGELIVLAVILGGADEGSYCRTVSDGGTKAAGLVVAALNWRVVNPVRPAIERGGLRWITGSC